MSSGRTRQPRWAGERGGSGLVWWTTVHAPWLMRAFWPRAHVGIPSFPTISGKRPASRRAKKQHARWLSDMRHMPQPNGAMAQHRRMEMATPEEQQRMFEDGL